MGFDGGWVRMTIFSLSIRLELFRRREGRLIGIDRNHIFMAGSTAICKVVGRRAHLVLSIYG
jgi:hypothetical protein